MTKVRLTELAQCAGCAAKMSSDVLRKALHNLSNVQSKNALVGFDTNDDAAVFQLSKTQAIVETVDFFPPVVDDPFAYGQIAAANAMSDIWAMGGVAIFALNVVAFPKKLDVKILREILAGGASKAKEAGIPILGGHSIHSDEPKYGMAVSGLVHPKRILTNAGARAGDMLILTKPLGTGVATTAIRQKRASTALTKLVTAQMATLNKKAGEVFASKENGVHALTDVTGFGLVGHATEMAKGAKCRAVIELEQVPFLSGITELAQIGIFPGGTKSNFNAFLKTTRYAEGMPHEAQLLLNDAQTNGGLLAAVPEKKVLRTLKALEKKQVQGFVIGKFERGSAGVDVI